jgi:hypothetical protein
LQRKRNFLAAPVVKFQHIEQPFPGGVTYVRGGRYEKTFVLGKASYMCELIVRGIDEQLGVFGGSNVIVFR